MYFTRHMRVLEQCIPNASIEMQKEIQNLREAFSQDTSQPFQLKRSLGLRSPSMESEPRSRAASSDPASAIVQSTGVWAHLQDAESSKTLSPASEYSQPFADIHHHPPAPLRTSSFDLQMQSGYPPTNLQRVTSAPQSTYELQPVVSNEQSPPVWDPSGIFNQWNTAFGAAQVAAAAAQQPTSIPDPRAQVASAHLIQQPQALSGQQTLYSSQQMSSPANSVVPETMPSIPTVTPVMWQNAFTNAYVSGHGHKRYRDESFDTHLYDQYQKRRG